MDEKIDLSPEALQKRREIAENATKGEWETITYGMEGNYVVISPIVDLKDSIATVKKEEDCFHIAANSPDAVIAMIDEIEHLRSENAQLRKELQWLVQKCTEACRRNMREGCLWSPNPEVGDYCDRSFCHSEEIDWRKAAKKAVEDK